MLGCQVFNLKPSGWGELIGLRPPLSTESSLSANYLYSRFCKLRTLSDRENRLPNGRAGGWLHMGVGSQKANQG